MRKFSLLTTVCLLAFVAAPAHAEDEAEGWYVGLGGGATMPRDSEIERTGFQADVEYDLGWTGLGTVGYRLTDSARTEVELGYRSNGVDEVSGATGDGDATSYSAMLNFLYDLHNSTGFVPYLGAGIGYAQVEFDGVGPLDDDDGGLALQGIAGLSYNATRALDIFMQYNYMEVFDLDGQLTTTGQKADVDYGVSSLIAGLRYRFGTPDTRPAAAPFVAPAVAMAQPEPAPAPAPVQPQDVSRSYLVFFDFDKSEIRPDANDILKQAAEDAKNGKLVRLELTGHADRSGSESYNMALSQRRAESARRRIQEFGIPANVIGTMAKGETQPLVPTEDGVKEPQNRRVEIVYTVSR